jgi:GNAT superfamily N-acetyltransferase
MTTNSIGDSASGRHPDGGDLPDDAVPSLAFHEVDRDRWEDFAALFEARGGPKPCWCMVWRVQGVGARHADGRREAMRGLVQAGVPIGLLGYLGETPVAWCSISPRDTYRQGLGGAGEPDTWSLACMFIRRDLRGQGITRQLIAAAVGHARACGAKVVEAYPVDPDSPSYRFMGFVPAFERAGFTATGRREGKRRHLMQLDLTL